MSSIHGYSRDFLDQLTDPEIYDEGKLDLYVVLLSKPVIEWTEAEVAQFVATLEPWDLEVPLLQIMALDYPQYLTWECQSYLLALHQPPIEA